MTSPFSYKVFGVWTNKELLEKYVFGLFITSIVGLFFALIYIADKALHLSKRAEDFIFWACGDVEMGLEAKSQVPFTLLGILSAYVFTFSGLQGLGASDPIWLSAKVAFGYSAMGGFFVVLQGGIRHYPDNARVLGVGTIMVQYWESFEKLENFAKNKSSSHLPAWAEFNKNIGSNGPMAAQLAV
jgi:hypothetical protein